MKIKTNWILWALLGLMNVGLMVAAAMSCGGCIDNVRVSPASTKITETVTEYMPDGRQVQVSVRAVESQSIGIRGRAESVDIKKIKAPSALLLGVASANAGDVTGISFEGIMDSPFLWLYIVGGLLIAGGVVVAIWLKQYKLGIALAVAGVALIAACVLFDKYPWVCLIGAILVLVGGGIWLFLYFRKSGNTSSALKVVTQAVEQSPAAASAAVKANVEKVAKAAGKFDSVKKTVKVAKGTV